MKKLLLVVLVIVVSMACVAQAATKAAVPGKSGLVVGVENAMPYIRLMPDNDMSVDLGANGTYTNSNSYTANVMARLNMKLADVNAITTGWGLELDVAQVSAAGASTTNISGTLLMSANYTVVNGVVVYGNLNLLTVNGTNGFATLLAGSFPCVYTGIRVNI